MLVGCGWFFAVGEAWRTELGSRWSGRRAAWTTTLTPARDAAGDQAAKRKLGSPQRHHLTRPWFGAWRAGVQPYLGARTRSGDMMGDRVPAHGGCGRSFYGGRPDQRGGRSIREPAAPNQRFRCPSAHDGQSCSGGGREFGGDQRLVAEGLQGVGGP